MLWGGQGDSDRNSFDEEKMMVHVPCKMEAPTNGTLEHPHSHKVSNMCCVASKMLKMEAFFAQKITSRSGGLVMWISKYFRSQVFLGGH